MAITIERHGQRVYLVGDTYSIKDRIKSMGGHWDGDRRAWWVGAKKEPEAQSLVASLSVPAGGDQPKSRQDPNDIRLTGKGVYKGKTYYLGAQTRDGTRIRCLTLPNAQGDYLDFWVPVAEIEVTKEYRPRERTYNYGRRRETVYTTLGSIARFITDQRSAEKDGLPACAACGKRGNLHHDMEDGLQKCYACCDMPE